MVFLYTSICKLYITFQPYSTSTIHMQVDKSLHSNQNEFCFLLSIIFTNGMSEASSTSGQVTQIVQVGQVAHLCPQNIRSQSIIFLLLKIVVFDLKKPDFWVEKQPAPLACVLPKQVVCVHYPSLTYIPCHKQFPHVEASYLRCLATVVGANRGHKSKLYRRVLFHALNTIPLSKTKSSYK